MFLVCFALLALAFLSSMENARANNDAGSLPTNAERPTRTELYSIPRPTFEEYGEAFDAITAANPNLDQNSERFSRLLFERLKQQAQTRPAK